MTRKIIVDQLKEYFALKGKVMTAEEYKEAEDAPIRIQVLKRKIGSWARVLNMVGDDLVVPAAVEPVKEPELVKPTVTKTKGA